MMTGPSAPFCDEVSDTRLASRVKNFLQSKVTPGRSKIDVEASGGVVTLRGSVGSFYHKQLFIHGAQRVAGVHQVVDELDVPLAQAK